MMNKYEVLGVVGEGKTVFCFKILTLLKNLNIKYMLYYISTQHTYLS